MELNGTEKTFSNQLQISRETLTQNLNKVKFETSSIDDNHHRAKAKLQKDQELKHLQQELELKSQLYTGNVLKGELINIV